MNALIYILIYLYSAITLQAIAQKTNTKRPWFAWIPIANLLLMCDIAKKPFWYVILLLIPIVNFVILFVLWREIAKARGKPRWWGILILVPIVNIIVPGYLAFSK